jgi:hypothetical protein
LNNLLDFDFCNGLHIGWGLWEAELGHKPILVEFQKESEKRNLTSRKRLEVDEEEVKA